MSDTTKKVLVYVFLAFFLVALADFYPRIAIWVALILVADVLLVNGSKYATFINNIQTTIGG